MKRVRVGALRCAAVLLWLLLASLAPRPALAQLPDLIDLDAYYMPSVELEEPRPAEAQVASYEGSLNVPLALSDTTFLVPGLAYHGEAISFSRTPPDLIELRAFHSFELPLLFVQLLPKRWSLSLRVAPGLAGDFHDVDLDMLRVSAVGLATHSFDSVVVGGGAIASYAFGSFLPLPAAYVDWTPSGWFRIEAFLPAFAATTFTIARRVELGVRAEVAGNSYAVRDARIARSWPCVATSDDPGTSLDESVADATQCFDHLAYSYAVAGVAVGVRIAGSLWATGFAGHTFYRRFEQMNDHDDRITGGVQDLPNSFLIRAGLTWRLPTEEDDAPGR